jgi:hypothetical protein
MKYYIEYNNIPICHNAKQTIETESPQLFVNIIGENELALTNYAERYLNIGNYGAIICRIYQEDLNKNQIEVLFKYKEHFGARLSKALKTAPKEIFV